MTTMTEDSKHQLARDFMKATGLEEYSLDEFLAEHYDKLSENEYLAGSAILALFDEPHAPETKMDVDKREMKEWISVNQPNVATTDIYTLSTACLLLGKAGLAVDTVTAEYIFPNVNTR